MLLVPLKANHMSEGGCYRHRSARDMAIFSLLKHAHKMFAEASVIQKLDSLEALYKNPVPDIRDLHKIFIELDPAFLDAFRIATCFENMFKAQLLKCGYVVHEIHSGTHKDLWNEQKVRPIRISEIRKIEGSNWKRRGDFTIRSLQSRTLGLPRFLNCKSRYKHSLRLSSRTIGALDLINKERNTVHLLVNDIKHLDHQLVDSYGLLRQLVNTRLITLHNRVTGQWAHLRYYPELRLREI